MTAQEARNIALNKNTNENDSQFAIILKMIKEAANKGEYEVWVYNAAILPDVRAKLETNGYEVGATQSDRNELLTIIKW